MSFDLSEKETLAMVETLLEMKKCRRITAGNGSFIEVIRSPLTCDADTGTCSI